MCPALARLTRIGHLLPRWGQYDPFNKAENGKSVLLLDQFLA